MANTISASLTLNNPFIFIMIQSVKGTKDILPDSVGYWNFIEDLFRSISQKYGYGELRTPIFEKTEVFHRTIGEATDIVNKEMYTFIDKGNESITLRPEMTAALVRAVVQNGMMNQNPLQKLWYFGPFFRYERPQKGRQRQFHQYGAECLGSPNPESDVEIITLAKDLIESAGVRNFKILLNSLGSKASRAQYRDELTRYFSSKTSELSDDSRTRLGSNPLRILDSKDPKDAAAIAHAPVILDFLDEESRNHFDAVKSFLDTAGIEYEITPQLVRGLDYYCHTVFEIQCEHLGAQNAIGGGGRYNDLIEQLGGKPTPAVGFAMGIERLLLILEQNGSLPTSRQSIDVYIITQNEKHRLLSQKLASGLRKAGISTQLDLLRRSMKAQIRDANRLNARFCLIFGDSEVERGCLTLKNMSDSEQKEIPFDNLDLILNEIR